MQTYKSRCKRSRKLKSNGTVFTGDSINDDDDDDDVITNFLDHFYYTLTEAFDMT
jgi:hypothetical protein